MFLFAFFFFFFFCQEGTDEEVAKAYGALEKALQKQRLLAAAIADQVTDQDTRKKIAEAVEAVRQVEASVMPAVLATRQNPADPRAAAEFAKVTNDLWQKVQKLTAVTGSIGGDDMTGNLVEMEKCIADLRQAIASKDVKAAKEAFEALKVSKEKKKKQVLN